MVTKRLLKSFLSITKTTYTGLFAKPCLQKKIPRGSSKIYSKRRYLDSLLSDYAANAGSAANEADYWEFQRYLSDKIDQLPERRREIFKLSKLEGKSYREIAALLNISENTVDMQMRSANSAIYQAIKRYLAYLLFVFLNI